MSAGLTILYDQIAEGQLTINEVPSKSLDSKNREIRFITDQIEELELQLAPALKRHSSEHTRAFCEAFQETLISGDKEATKAYLSSVISEIWDSQGEVKILGRKLQLAAAISEWTQDTQIPAVPSVVTNWRAWHDSNVRPPGS